MITKKTIFSCITFISLFSMLLCNAETKKCLNPDKFTFFTIAPTSIGTEERLAKAMIEFKNLSGNDIVLYCMTLHPEGRPAMDKARMYLDSYKKLKKSLEGSGVKLGVLLQSIVGHWPRVDKNEEQWTRSIDINGNVKRFCILDNHFQKYISDVVEMFAKEKPVFIMGDDDIRTFSPLVECFCPLHVAEFNKRTGKNFTSKQLREAVKNCNANDDVFTSFETLRIDTNKKIVEVIREAIDNVNPNIETSTCMPWWATQDNAKVSKVMAGKHQPALRICNSLYLTKSPNAFVPMAIRTQALYEANKHIPILLDESDTCPHNLYAMSSSSLHSKICQSAMVGLKGSKLWFVNAYFGNYPISRNYTKVISENTKLYNKIVNEVKNSTSYGVLIPLEKELKHYHPYKNPTYFYIHPKSWAETLFGTYGIPFQCTADFTQDGVYAIAGKHAVECLSDAQLKQLLSRKLLIDGTAAAEITKRGFAKYLGVEATNKDFKFNSEQYANKDESLAITKEPCVPFLKILDNNIKVLTNLLYKPSYISKNIEYVCPATVLYKNELGGHVCTMVYGPFVNDFVLQNEARKDLLEDVIAMLNGEVLITVRNYQNFFAYARKLTDDSTLINATNLNSDVAQTIKLKLSFVPKKVEILQPNGTWKNALFTTSNNEIEIKKSLTTYDCAIIKIK